MTPVDVALRTRLDRIRGGSRLEAERFVTAYGIRTVPDLIDRVYGTRPPTPWQFDVCADGFAAAEDLRHGIKWAQ